VAHTTSAMTTATVTFIRRSYTPLAFRPETERRVVLGLSAAVIVLFVLVIPIEFLLYA
jgi:hypothetical protein